MTRIEFFRNERHSWIYMHTPCINSAQYQLWHILEVGLGTANLHRMDDCRVVEGKVDWRGRPARKDMYGGAYGTLFIHVFFGVHSFATIALSVNLVTYFNQVMHFPIATAANMVTTLLGTSFILSVVVACFADTFVGRYKAALISAWIEFMGLGLLTVQAHNRSLKPLKCDIFDQKSRCEEIKGGNLVLLYIGLYSVAFGMAGVKAGLPTHGADQFDENDSEEAPKISAFFNWLFLSDCIGGAFSLIIMVLIQNKKGWDWGFGVSAIGILVGILIFVAGISRYRYHIIGGTNPIVEIIQVYVASIRKRNCQLPRNPQELYELNQDKEYVLDDEFIPHSDSYRFLDKAAVRQSSDATFKYQSPWKLCRVTQVEKAKTILGMLPIFASSIIVSTCLAQLQTFSIQQGTTMDTRITDTIKIPPASLPIIPTIFLIMIVPIYEGIVVPLARKLTGHPTGITHLQRIGVGLVLSGISMATAALVEVKRKNVAKSHDMLDTNPELQSLPISTFWLSFQYFIFGIADFLTYVGLLEFFYSEAPKTLKSTATSFHWCSLSLGYFLSTILVQLVNLATEGSTSSGGWLTGNNVNRNYLNNFYWLLAVLCFLNFIGYLHWAGKYNYKPEATLASDTNKA